MAQYTEVEGVVKAVTDKAVLVNVEFIDGEDDMAGEEIWIPRSNIDDEAEDAEKGENVTLDVETWFLKREGHM